MGAGARFNRYMAHLSAGLGHWDRHAGLQGYGSGLMLPLALVPARLRLAGALCEWSDRRMPGCRDRVCRGA